MDSKLPKALRATRLPGRWPRRPSFRYDALYADGTVLVDVKADEVMRGRRFPADAWATLQAAETACGNDVPGDWVEYATGRRLP
jgi:hypothetical protein